ncbi:unnamed protein product, partial [Closterium sp. Naga37s-1]
RRRCAWRWWGRRPWACARCWGRSSRCACVTCSKLTPADRTLEPEWYEIVAKEGKKSSVGKVLLHVVAARAPPQQPIKLFIGSWNVGNAPPPDDLPPWLPKGTDHELIAIGSQKAITDVTATSEATGIGHVIANKGAVSVSLKFWDTSFCFVNSHLAAHEGHCMTHNDNYREVMRYMHPGLSSIEILSQFRPVNLCLAPSLSISPHLSPSLPISLHLSPSLAEVVRNMHPGSTISSGWATSTTIPLTLFLSPTVLSVTAWGLSSIDLLSQFHSTIFHQTYLSLSPLPNLSIPFTEVMRNMHPGLSSIDLLSQFHHVFWMGDLSTTAPLTLSHSPLPSRMALHRSILEKIDQGNFADLLQHDELQREIREGRSFYKFCEAPIAFAPTFKVISPSLPSTFESTQKSPRYHGTRHVQGDLSLPSSAAFYL